MCASSSVARSEKVFYLLLLMLMGALIFLPFLSTKDFYSRGEPREALVAQSMLVTGTYVLGTGYGGAVPSKPPLLHWMIVACSKAMGELDELTARLPSALSSLVFLFCFFVVLARQYAPGTAFLSAAALLLSVEWFRSSVTCRVDMIFSVLLAGGLFAGFLWSELKQVKMLCIAIMAFTGATLSKGPVSILLPAIIFSIYWYGKKEKLIAIVGKLAMLFVAPCLFAGIWYFLAFRQGGGAFFSKFWYENFARFLSTQEDEPHKHGPLYLLGTLVPGLLPMSVFVFVVAAVWRRELWSSLSLRTLKQKWEGLDGMERFSLLVAVSFLLFFSIPSSKRSTYLLPSYPFLAFLCIRLFQARLSETVLRVGVRVWAGVLLIILLSATIFTYTEGVAELVSRLIGKQPEILVLRDQMRNLFSRYFYFPLASAAGTALYAFSLIAPSWWKRKERPVWAGHALALFFSFYMSIQATILPALSNTLSPKPLSAELASLITDTDKVYSFNYEFYALSVYLRREIFRFEDYPQARGKMLLFSDDIPRLPEGVKITPIYESKYSVYKAGRRVVLADIE